MNPGLKPPSGGTSIGWRGGLATLINTIDPDVIVLAGGMSQITELYEEVPARWAEYVFSDTVATPLVPAVHGDSSGVRGAAWLWE